MMQRTMMQSRIDMSKETRKSSSKIKNQTVIKHSIGIDISKDKFDVCYKTYDLTQRSVIKGSRSFKNTLADYCQFVQWSAKRQEEGIPQVFTMEATGVYYERLAFYLYDHGYHVSVVLPSRSRKYFQSQGIRTKTDKIDAGGLAQMGAEKSLPIWNRPNDWTVSLRQTTRQREQIQETRTVLINQKEALLHNGLRNDALIQNLNVLLESVDETLKSLEKQITTTINQDPVCKKKIECICQIKGVGQLTVATLLAETNCFMDFHSGSQLVSYAGYDVVENQSGNHRGPTRISKQGNSHIRRAMHMPALGIKKFNGDSVLTNLWDRVYERTKKKMKAYVAVQRKLLVLIYTLWKNDVEYIPGYKKKPCPKAGLN